MSLKTLPWMFAAAVAVAVASPAVMAQKMSPGLWEHKISMKSQSGRVEAAMQQMQQSLASMPPEQRKMMQDMMAAQGMSFGAMGGTVRVCITKEQAEREQAPQAQEGCTQNAKRNGNVWQISFKCSGPPPSSGEGTVTLQGATAYTGSFNVLTEVEDKPERMQMINSGKWISANCGNIKPVE